MTKNASEQAKTVKREAVLDRFTASLDRLEVTWSRCAPEEAAEVLAEAVVQPAVAAPLPFENFSLDDGLGDDVPLTLVPSTDQVEAAHTGVTAAFLGIADYGSVVIQHGADAEAVSLFPDRHVAVLRAQDIVPDMPRALSRLAEALRAERSSFVLATGPSATADMGALVRGAHGPRAVHVVILENKDA